MGSRRRPRPEGKLRAILLAILVTACSTVPGAAPAGAPSPQSTRAAPSWGAATPESQGFDSLILADVVAALRRDDPGLHGIAVGRRGSLILDAAFYPYDGVTPHQLSSVTKVLTTMLLGIAVDRGLVALDDPVLSFFPEVAEANGDPRRGRITLLDLAAMTTGQDCTSADEERTLHEMTTSEDWVRFALDLPMATEPGDLFRYCSPATHLLSAVLAKAAGVPTLDFARQFVFEPLGISSVWWSADPQGIHHGFGDLYLLPHDVVKLGQLWANGGTWNGRRIVSETWVQEAITARSPTGGPDDYGLGWWVPRTASGAGSYVALGHGGQMLLVRPDLELVLAVVGSGVEPDGVAERILAALVSRDRSLLADPAGEARLADVIASVAAAPEPIPPAGPKTTIRAISGVTWSLEGNPLGLEAIRLDLKAGARVGTVAMSFPDRTDVQSLRVGLDGRYRVGLDRHARPVAIRGTWADSRTFVLDIDELADGRAWSIRLGIRDDVLTLEGHERGHDGSFVVTSRAVDRAG
jgi:CubicO group peptidase (beta-lactamase class C family)